MGYVKMLCFLIGLFITILFIVGIIKLFASVGIEMFVGLLGIIITLICILFKVAFSIVIGIILFKVLAWLL